MADMKALILALTVSLVAPAAATADDVGAFTGLCRFGNQWMISGDWDGDGVDGPGIVHESDAGLEWFLRNEPGSGPVDIQFSFGPKGAMPVVGDWDAKGGDGVGVVTNNEKNLRWRLRNTLSLGDPDANFTFGTSASDLPVAGDWDGKNGERRRDDPYLGQQPAVAAAAERGQRVAVHDLQPRRQGRRAAGRRLGRQERRRHRDHPPRHRSGVETARQHQRRIGQPELHVR